RAVSDSVVLELDTARFRRDHRVDRRAPRRRSRDRRVGERCRGSVGRDALFCPEGGELRSGDQLGRLVDEDVVRGPTEWALRQDRVETDDGDLEMEDAE